MANIAHQRAVRKRLRPLPSGRTSVSVEMDGVVDPSPASVSIELHTPHTVKWGKKNTHLAPEAKTRVGNRKQMLPNADERDKRVRRAKEIYFGILNDLGGPDYVTTLQDNIAKHLAFLIVRGEEMQELWIANDPKDDFLIFIAFLKTAAQTAKLLGLKRVKVVKAEGEEPQNLDEYIEGLEKERRKAGKPKPRVHEVDADPIEPLDPEPDPDDPDA